MLFHTALCPRLSLPGSVCVSHCHHPFPVFIVVRGSVTEVPVSILGLGLWDFKWRLSWLHGVPLPFPTDSSKELEELRSMFTRALEYLQQEVEERKWPAAGCPVAFPVPACRTSSRPGALPLHPS